MNWMDVAEFLDMDFDTECLWMIPAAAAMWAVPLSLYGALAVLAHGMKKAVQHE